MSEAESRRARLAREAETAQVEAERPMAEAMHRRTKLVSSGEFNPGGGEYRAELPRGPAGTGGQVGDGRDDDMSTILVPLDGSELAEAALPVARQLAQGLHAEVVLVTVGVAPETGTQADDERAALERLLLRATDQLRSVRVRRRIAISNDPAQGLVEAAREEQPDLIVMTTHGRSGWSRLVQGSVAESVVRSGVAPVTLVQPRGGAEG